MWDRVLKKNLHQNSTNLVVGLTILTVSIPLLIFEFIAGYTFLFIGLFYSYSSIKYFLRVRKNKRKFLETLEEEINGHIQNLSVCTWEFESNYFHYTDYRFDHKIKWFAFSEYEVIDSVLFLKLNNSVTPGFILEEAEVGEDNFAKLKEFLSQRIKSNPPPRM